MWMNWYHGYLKMKIYLNYDLFCVLGVVFFFKYKTTIVILTCWALFYTKLKNCLHLEYEQNVIGKEIHNHIKTLCVKKKQH